MLRPLLPFLALGLLLAPSPAHADRPLRLLEAALRFEAQEPRAEAAAPQREPDLAVGNAALLERLQKPKPKPTMKLEPSKARQANYEGASGPGRSKLQSMHGIPGGR